MGLLSGGPMRYWRRRTQLHLLLGIRSEGRRETVIIIFIGRVRDGRRPIRLNILQYASIF